MVCNLSTVFLLFFSDRCVFFHNCNNLGKISYTIVVSFLSKYTQQLPTKFHLHQNLQALVVTLSTECIALVAGCANLAIFLQSLRKFSFEHL